MPTGLRCATGAQRGGWVTGLYLLLTRREFEMSAGFEAEGTVIYTAARIALGRNEKIARNGEKC